MNEEQNESKSISDNKDSVKQSLDSTNEIAQNDQSIQLNEGDVKSDLVKENNVVSAIENDLEIITTRPEDDTSFEGIKSVGGIGEGEQVKNEEIQTVQLPVEKPIEKQGETLIETKKIEMEPLEINRKESLIENFKTDEREQYEKVEAIAKEYKKMINDKIFSTEENFTTFITNLKKNFESEPEEDKQNRKKRNQKMKKIDQVLSLASVLRRSIETNFDLLNLILLYSGSDVLNIKQFIGENIDKILDSWLITHMDSDQLSNIKQSNKTPQNIKNYIFQDLKKALKHLKINGNREIDLKGIKKINKTNLKKLIVNCVNPEMFEQLFLNDSGSAVFFQVSKVDIKHCNLEQIDVAKFFPEIDHLSIQSSKISFMNIDRWRLQRLTELSLSRINMTNNSWNLFKKGLLANKHLMNNLEVISLANNKLSMFSLYDDKVKSLIDRESVKGNEIESSTLKYNQLPKEEIQSQNKIEETIKKDKKQPQSTTQVRKRKFAFPNLRTIDLENNKMSKFLIENYNMVESLQVLNLVSNNFSFVENLVSLQRPIKENGIKRPQTLVLLQKNNYLFKPEKRQEYLDYLIPLLASFKYSIKKLTFDYLFYLNNKTSLNQLAFSIKIQESLKILSMSSCSLTNVEIISIIKGNKFENLRKLDISCNFIDDNLFKESRINQSNRSNKMLPSSLLVNKDIEVKCVFEKLVKLEEINLSGNKIRGEQESIENIREFLKNNLALKKITFYNTPLEELFGSLMKEIKKREKRNTPAELQGNENKEKNKDKKTEELLLRILNQTLMELEEKDFTNKTSYFLFEFIKGIKTYNSQLKLYFKNTYSSATAKKFKSIWKNIRMKKASDREGFGLS